VPPAQVIGGYTAPSVHCRPRAPSGGGSASAGRARRLFRPCAAGCDQLGVRASGPGYLAACRLAGRPRRSTGTPGPTPWSRSVSRHAIGRQRGEATTTVTLAGAGGAVVPPGNDVFRRCRMLAARCRPCQAWRPRAPLCRQQACRAQLRAEGIRPRAFPWSNCGTPTTPAAGNKGPESACLPVTSRASNHHLRRRQRGRLRLTLLARPASASATARLRSATARSSARVDTTKPVVKLQGVVVATAPTRASSLELSAFDKNPTKNRSRCPTPKDDGPGSLRR